MPAAESTVDEAHLRSVPTNVAGTRVVRHSRAADEIKDVVEAVRPFLRRSATSMPPYRHYYVHLSPPARRQERLPQLLSLYMLFFYFGSVTRYRPHVFDEILSSNYGPFVREFIASQPDQLLYCWRLRSASAKWPSRH